MRLDHCSCPMVVGFLGWLAVAVPASAQGVVAPAPVITSPPVVAPHAVITEPTVVVPPGGAGCQCAPGTGCQCAPGAVTPGITTWDPYTAPQPGILPVVPGLQPAIAAPCAPQTFRFAVFGEYLYWRPGTSTSTDFAVPINGAIVPPPEPTIPAGSIATLDPDFDNGFRFGVAWQRTCESQLSGTYTWFESQDDHAVTLDPAGGLVLLPLVVHPATVAADFFYTDAMANYDLEYETIDIDYRHVLCSDCLYRVNYIAGVRFLRFDEEFGAVFTSPTRIDTVSAGNEFEGFGIRGGLEGEWGGQQGGIFGYGRLIGGAIAGEMTSSYVQQSNFDGIVVTMLREDDRIVPTLEAEIGVGWRSRNGRWRLSAGYNITALFNLASVNSLIDSVQSGNFSDSDDTFTLDGLVARAEFAF